MKTFIPLRILKLKHMIVLILMIITAPLFSQIITTSQGTFKLTPPGDLVGPTAARSAQRVAELAISALANDVEKIISDKKDLISEINDNEGDWRKYDNEHDGYKRIAKDYRAKNDRYSNELNNYTSDLNYHNSETGTYNSKAQENRDRATYQRLMTSKARLDGWKRNLDYTMGGLQRDYSELEKERIALTRVYDDLKGQEDKLYSRLSNLKFKEGMAYKQLVQLNDYAKEISGLLEKLGYHPLPLATYNLNTLIEQLKAISGEGWDGTKH
ncbi:MAG: hypothetical protein JKZ03_02515 [Flavobacteriaceae bacterium]|nr:hypothetical protein [Flavobacteriaceae bacterium]